uniref:Uncharacterized protein n=1 Tax=viral metagenome TaxID=1070528 RepID=A0A6M3LJB4_9ZZZZ
MINENHLIFKCQLSVAFNDGTEYPYTMDLQGIAPDEWLHYYEFKTLESACEALGSELPGIIAKRQTPPGSTHNCPPRGQEKA